MYMIYILMLVICLLVICVWVVLKSHINDLEKHIEDLESELTKHESHVNGAFKGAYFLQKDLENKIMHHCHSYCFDNGVLYIKDPIITHIPDDEDIVELNEEN